MYSVWRVPHLRFKPLGTRPEEMHMEVLHNKVPSLEKLATVPWLFGPQVHPPTGSESDLLWGWGQVMCSLGYYSTVLHTCIHAYIHTYITLITYIHYITLHGIALHYIALHCIAFHYITLHYIHTYINTYINTYIHTLMHYLHYLHTYIHTIAYHCIALHCIILHYIHTIALHCIALHYIHTYTHTHIHPSIHTCMHAYIHTLHYITSHHITLHYITYIHAYNQYNTQQTQSGHPETQQCIESMWESQKNRMLPKETWPKFMRHRSWPAENQHSQSVAGSSQPWVGKSRLLVSDRLSIYLPQGRRRAERRWKPFTAFPRKELCCQTAVLRNFLLESEMLTIYIYRIYLDCRPGVSQPPPS